MSVAGNLLFVDDEKRVLTSMRALFRRDYNVFTANSGQEALEILAENQVDVVISDQRMPEMTGVEMLCQAKQLTPQVTRILLTGYADLKAIEDSLNDSEVFRYLMKPCPPAELREAIAAGIELARIEPSADEVDAPASPQVPAADAAPVGQAFVRSSAAAPDANGVPEVAPLAPQRPATPEHSHAGAHLVPIARRKPKEVDVLVISADQDLVSNVAQSVRKDYRVHSAHSLEEARPLLAQHPVGVVVTDTGADETKLAQFRDELDREVPNLVLIVASDRSDAHALIQLINRGGVFRFLLKPIQAAQCRIWLNSAVTRFQALSKPTLRSSVGSRKSTLSWWQRLFKPFMGSARGES